MTYYSSILTGPTHSETTPSASSDSSHFSHIHSSTLPSSPLPLSLPCSPLLNTILEEDFGPSKKKYVKFKTASYKEQCLALSDENGDGDGGGGDGGGDGGGGGDGDGGGDGGGGKIIKEVKKKLFVIPRQRKVPLAKKPDRDAHLWASTEVANFPFGHQRPRRSSQSADLSKVPGAWNSANTLIHTPLSGDECSLFQSGCGLLARPMESGCGLQARPMESGRGRRTSSLPTLHYLTPPPSRPQSSLVTHALCSSDHSSSDPSITAKLANEATPTLDDYGSGDYTLNRRWPTGSLDL